MGVLAKSFHLTKVNWCLMMWQAGAWNVWLKTFDKEKGFLWTVFLARLNQTTDRSWWTLVWSLKEVISIGGSSHLLERLVVSYHPSWNNWNLPQMLTLRRWGKKTITSRSEAGKPRNIETPFGCKYCSRWANSLLITVQSWSMILRGNQTSNVFKRYPSLEIWNKNVLVTCNILTTSDTIS